MAGPLSPEMPRHGSDEGIGHAQNFEGLPDQNKHSSIRNKRSNHKSSLSWKEVAQWMKLSGWRKQLSVCVIKICLVALSWLSRKLTQAWWVSRLLLIGQSSHPLPLIGRTTLLSRCGPGVDLLTSSHHNPRGFPDNSPGQVTSTGCAEIIFSCNQ